MNIEFTFKGLSYHLFNYTQYNQHYSLIFILSSTGHRVERWPAWERLWISQMMTHPRRKTWKMLACLLIPIITKPKRRYIDNMFLCLNLLFQLAGISLLVRCLYLIVQTYVFDQKRFDFCVFWLLYFAFWLIVVAHCPDFVWSLCQTISKHTALAKLFS